MNRRERRRAAKRGDIVEIKLGRVTIKPGDNTCFLCSKPATAWPRSQGMAYGGFVRINRRIALLCEQCFTTEEKQTPSQHRRRDQRARRQADKLTPPSASPEGRHQGDGRIRARHHHALGRENRTKEPAMTRSKCRRRSEPTPKISERETLPT